MESCGGSGCVGAWGGAEAEAGVLPRLPAASATACGDSCVSGGEDSSGRHQPCVCTCCEEERQRKQGM